MTKQQKCCQRTEVFKVGISLITFRNLDSIFFLILWGFLVPNFNVLHHSGFLLSSKYLTFALHKTVETLCTTCLNIENLQILPKKCICMFYMILAVYESCRIN